ncbi:MAG: glycosyltransferase family 4 protein [Armatimonadetes bacterium]|nr:glycosyltransferase family 4 protein [Armatimonadota bacterium]
MRILYVGRNAKIGGGSTFRLNIGRGMLARGHDVAIAALGGPMVARYQKAGIRYHWIPPFTICSGMLARAIRRHKVELVHASNTTAGDLALRGCQSAGVPFVVSLHNTITRREAQHPCLKEARQIIVFDTGAAASAGKFTHEFNTSKIVRVPRPVEHRSVDPDKISPLHVAYVARLSSRKGKVALSVIEAFGGFAREHPGARLTILGDGSMRNEVIQHAARVVRDADCEIQVRGPVIDPHVMLETAGVLIGAGYAALEAVMQGRAVIGAGFKGYGVVTEANVLDAIECNFGDTVGRWEMSPANFREALGDVASGWGTPETRTRFWALDRIVAPIHGIDGVAARLEEIYREVVGTR